MTEISEYERKRAANIKANEALMVSLGLVPLEFEAHDKTKKNSRVKQPKSTKTAPTRASRRLQGKAVDINPQNLNNSAIETNADTIEIDYDLYEPNTGTVGANIEGAEDYMYLYK